MKGIFGRNKDKMIKLESQLKMKEKMNRIESKLKASSNSEPRQESSEDKLKN